MILMGISALVCYYNSVVVVDLYVDHNASGIIVVSNITSEMTPEISRK